MLWRSGSPYVRWERSFVYDALFLHSSIVIAIAVGVAGLWGVTLVRTALERTLHGWLELLLHGLWCLLAAMRAQSRWSWTFYVP